MSISRRQFVVSAASLAAGAAAPTVSLSESSASPGGERQITSPVRMDSADDPLGVRGDFPIVRGRTYLNSAYITPVPNQVVAAGRAFVESKAVRPIPLGEMLRKTDEVRAQFARLINAETDEIGFLYSTSEGENVVANALDLKAGDNVVVDDLHYETEFVLLGDGRFQLYKTAKRFDYATLPFSEVYQLGAGIEYVQRVGVDRIEQHTVALAHQLRAGLASQGYRLFTPEGNRSSIVTYYSSKDAATLTAAFERASIDVTVRGPLGQVRVSPALFNTGDDIRRFLEVTRRLV